MANERLKNYIIMFNFLMSLLLFLSSQLTILTLRGWKITSVDFFIYYDYATRPTPMPTAVIFPILNYPLIIFIIMLIANLYFYHKLSNQE